MQEIKKKRRKHQKTSERSNARRGKLREKMMNYAGNEEKDKEKEP